MNEELLDRVAEEVMQRLNLGGPRALLVGQQPPDLLGYQPVIRPPYDAVIIGSLSAAELLQFANAPAIDALLSGKSVYLYEGGLSYRTQRQSANRMLYNKLQAAERNLQQLGIRFYGGSPAGKLVTASEARELKRRGMHPPANAVITPMAREILEGKPS